MRFLRIKEVLQLTGKSKSALYGDPSFPKPVKIGSQASAWVDDEISEWMACRVKERDDVHAMEQR
jgi:prophage regulatory protein